jgi:hypothetical protein
MTTTATTATTAAHLRTIALHWADLHDALDQPAIHHGFGIGLRGHLAAADDRRWWTDKHPGDNQ